MCGTIMGSRRVSRFWDGLEPMKSAQVFIT